jgi:glycerol-3-phosphate dehydrogenase
LEREDDLACGASKANSGVVHGGEHDAPGSLKAKLCVEGNALYPNWCKELKVPFKPVGSLVVAFNDEDMQTLNFLMEQGKKNGVPGLEILDQKGVKQKEPNISDTVNAGLWVPTVGVVSPYMLTVAQAENAVINGAKVMLGTKVNGLILENGKVAGVKTTKGEMRAKWIINAAGVYADEIMRMAGINKLTIKPRKGVYYLLDKSVGKIVNTVIFPAPNKISKGILVLPTAHGNALMGPTATTIHDKEDTSTDAPGLDEVYRGALKIFPQISKRDTITQFAGLRAGGNTGDFVIEVAPEIKGIVNVAGIESPGLTSAPAIGKYVVQLLKGADVKLEEKKNFDPHLPKRPEFAEMSNAEKAKLIAKDARYANVICRCETITEGEIVDAIHRPIPATTMDAIKRRTRAGMGRCQSGFCGPRVAEILARELNIPITDITKDGTGSNVFFGKTKEKVMA